MRKQILIRQSGVSLTGLILVLAVLGVAAVFALKLVPTYSEYSAIKDSTLR